MNLDKNIFAQAQSFYTQEDFNKALTEAKAEIMAIAIETTKQAIFIERDACAEIAHNMEKEREKGGDDYKSPIADAILNRIPVQRQ